MKNRDKTQILGALFLSFGQACINFKFLIAEEIHFLEHIKADEWYPLEKFLNILNIVKEKYSDPAPVFEQIGVEMMNLWYSHGPGKHIINRGIDFLHFQTSSEGYYSVIRGKPEQIGEFSLLSLDEEKGTAVVRSTTLFNRDMERGVLIGGLGTTKDLLYINVDNTENEDIFQILFQDSQKVFENGERSLEIPEDISLTTLYWKHKMLEDDFKRYNAFWNSTNETLSQAFEKLGNQDEELRERTAELLQANTLLKQEIAERKQAQKRIERLNQLKEALLGPLSFNKKLKHITDGIVTIFDADFARIWITKPGDLCDSGCFHANVTEGPHVCRYRNLCLRLMASSGRYTHLDGEVHRRVPFGCYKIGQIASGEEAKFITNDVTHDPRVHNHKWAQELGLGSFAGYRLLSAVGKPVGVLALFSKHVLSPEDDGLLEGLANTTTQVIQNATAEEELKIYQVMIESAQDAIFYKDLESRYISANDKTLEAFGLPREEVIGKNDFELMPGRKEAKQNVQEDQTVFKSGKTTEFSKRMTAADNKEYWFQAIKVPQFDNEGKVKGLVGIARDITELKRAENALRESEAELRALFAGMPDVVIMLDHAGRYLKIAPTKPELLYKQEDELRGKSLHETFPQDQADIFLEHVQQSLATQQLIKLEYSLNIEGTELWFDGRIAPMSKNAVVFVARDITERKHVEEAIQRQNKQLTLLNRISQMLSSSLDLDTVLETVLEEVRRLLNAFSSSFWLVEEGSEYLVCARAKGAGSEKLIGQKLPTGQGITGWAMANNESVLVDDVLMDERHIEHVDIETGVVVRSMISIPLRCKGTSIGVLNVVDRRPGHFTQGDARLLEPIATAAATSIDNALLYTTAQQEIEERKQVQHALQLAKERAEAAQRASETANQAKSVFLANMSHELRTPLNSILGYTQILRRDKSVTKQQKNAVDTIHYSSEHLLTLINELLDLSRIEARKMELELADVYFPGFLKGITEITRIRAGQEGISFECDIASDVPPGVHADEKRLRQVLLNLLNNAIKFTEEGNVVFRVRAESLPAQDATSPPTRIHFEVEDTGVGISPDKLEDIFLPFHQVHKTQLTTEGTGLGLPISQNLVRLMGSKLHVKSVVEQGTIFWFDLELPEVEGISASEIVSAARQSRHIIGSKGETRKILLADDNEKNRAVLRDMLLPLGFEIAEAVNGQDALTQATLFSPELILMDLVMPVMDGLEATRQIRQSSALKGVIVIGVSASALEAQRQVSLQAGCDDFLAKPIHIDDLLDRLQRHLRLEWLYEEPSETDSGEQHASDTLPLVVPPKVELETVLEFAEISHITGLQQSLENIKRMDQEFIPFVTRIEELAENFRFKQIIKMIQSYLQGGKP